MPRRLLLFTNDVVRISSMNSQGYWAIWLHTFCASLFLHSYFLLSFLFFFCISFIHFSFLVSNSFWLSSFEFKLAVIDEMLPTFCIQLKWSMYFLYHFPMHVSFLSFISKPVLLLTFNTLYICSLCEVYSYEGIRLPF